jgi:hypothetical protein
MPYALIPDGYSLKKVTKLEKQAVDSKRRHDNVVTVLNNPEIIKQIIVAGVAFLAVREGKEALDDLKGLGVSISKDAEEAFTRKRSFGAPTGAGVSFEQILEEGLKRIPFL